MQKTVLGICKLADGPSAPYFSFLCMDRPDIMRVHKKNYCHSCLASF